MNSKGSVSVVTPVFNQSLHTERFLGCLLENSTSLKEVVVVDNHSTDQTSEVLAKFRSLFEQIDIAFHVISNLENRGYGRACNQGISKASGSFVAVSNNDIWLMPNWDGILIKKLSELNADMVGPYFDENFSDVTLAPVRARRFLARNHGKYRREYVPVLSFFKKVSLDKLGGFDERFFLTYEDADLHKRMNDLGMKYYKVADCYGWHSSKGTRSAAKLPADYEIEGLRLYMEKWGFDPRTHEHTYSGRLKRRWQKIKDGLGLF
jgi:GT2 family glycosyltransferase